MQAVIGEQIVADRESRLRKLAEALCMTPPPTIRLELRRVGGRRKWWLCGCLEGDQALPMTADAKTAEEALEAAEGWLAPELDAANGRSAEQRESATVERD